MISNDGQMVDIHGAKRVEISLQRQPGKVWVNVANGDNAEGCKLRAQNSPIVVKVDGLDLQTFYEELVDLVVRDVAEIPDRERTDNWPEVMIVTDDELRNILRKRLGIGD